MPWKLQSPVTCIDFRIFFLPQASLPITFIWWGVVFDGKTWMSIWQYYPPFIFHFALSVSLVAVPPFLFLNHGHVCKNGVAVTVECCKPSPFSLAQFGVNLVLSLCTVVLRIAWFALPELRRLAIMISGRCATAALFLLIPYCCFFAGQKKKLPTSLLLLLLLLLLTFSVAKFLNLFLLADLLLLLCCWWVPCPKLILLILSAFVEFFLKRN